jgi:hypothetical protein
VIDHDLDRVPQALLRGLVVAPAGERLVEAEARRAEQVVQFLALGRIARTSRRRSQRRQPPMRGLDRRCR